MQNSIQVEALLVDFHFKEKKDSRFPRTSYVIPDFHFELFESISPLFEGLSLQQITLI